jgi:uncharacterized protein YdhG (YjbR/CyaY superfamily)
MVTSKASTVEEYLQELPPERRAVIAEVRERILENLPAGYVERMRGAISYEIPLEDYPETYNGQPLNYVALAAQKHHYAVYLTCVYQDPQQEKILREGFEDIGKKPYMGKSCVRFRKLENIPLDVIGELIASTPPEKLIAQYEETRKK